MLRKPRMYLSGVPARIIQCGNNRDAYFSPMKTTCIDMFGVRVKTNDSLLLPKADTNLNNIYPSVPTKIALERQNQSFFYLSAIRERLEGCIVRIIRSN